MGLLPLWVASPKSPNKYKRARYAIKNSSMKDLLNIISKFKKLPYKSYERRRPKHEPTDSYFYLSRQLAMCMMRADALNLHIYPVRTKMNMSYDATGFGFYSRFVRRYG